MKIKHIFLSLIFISNLFIISVQADNANQIGQALGDSSRVWETGGIPSEDGENVNWGVNNHGDLGKSTYVGSGGGGAGVATSYLKTTVVGPCTISFDYRIQTYLGYAVILCDDEELMAFNDVATEEFNWRGATYKIPEGEHEISFIYVHPGRGFVNQFNGFAISNFKVDSKAPAFSIESIKQSENPIGLALGDSSRIWETGGIPSEDGENVNWGVNNHGDLGKSTYVGSGGGGAGVATSYLKTKVVGPCTISFDYRIRTYYGEIKVLCDETELMFFNKLADRKFKWTKATYEIPEGEHEISFIYVHPGRGFVNQFNGFAISNFKVDSKAPAFSIESIKQSENPIGLALGDSSRIWETGGIPSREGENVKWGVCNRGSNVGKELYVGCGAGGAGVATSYLKTKVVGPCTISFDYRIRTYYGEAKVLCDETELMFFNGLADDEFGWRSATYEIPKGEHEISFIYVHPGRGFKKPFNGFLISNFKVENNE